MKKYMLVLFALGFSMASFAHNPNVSTTMLVEKGNNSWVLQISASLTAFQQEIRTHFSETPYQSPEEFQQMVLEHIKNNLHISFNSGEDISFGNGAVKLGHETMVVYEVFDIPSDINSVLLTNTIFKDIHQNQSALILLKEGFNKERFVLNNANDHTLSLAVDGNQFVEVGKNEASFFSSSIGVIVLGVAAILVLGLIVLGVGHLFNRSNKSKEVPLTIVR
ncbi:hypothetical protein MWU78_11270 [Arenibacter sp. F26102]|uniref:DUF6702 family protein n=1 Tax=Arenibacter sp. F26102 TaxID=2926416 RepID=UPI001FF343BF|nr:DUF6702 family protein [Arenibacter sp. F26102]MCK0146224.1 hypothetical protein [Arenibacter sp. F26102]